MEKKQINTVYSEIINSFNEVAVENNTDINKSKDKSEISNILDDFTKHDKRVRKEFKNSINKIIKSNLNKGNDSTKIIVKEVKKFISSGNYKKLAGVIKSKDLNIFDDYNIQLKDNAVKPGKIQNKNKIKGTINLNAEYTILVNGTTDITNSKKDSLQRKLADSYYLTKNEKLNSEEAAKEYAYILKSNNYKFINWLGDNILKSMMPYKETMKTKAKEIANWILDANPSSINLIGHSHGGNIMVLVVNRLHKKKFDVVNKVFNLITLSSPVRRDIQLNKEIENKINHTEFFSKKDFVQNTGFIDNVDYGSILALSLITSFFGLIPVLCGAFGLHNFKYAKNRIDITNFIENANDSNNIDKIFDKVNSELKSMYNEKCPFKYHQATRSVNLFMSLLKENNLV